MQGKKAPLDGSLSPRDFAALSLAAGVTEAAGPTMRDMTKRLAKNGYVVLRGVGLFRRYRSGSA